MKPSYLSCTAYARMAVVGIILVSLPVNEPWWARLVIGFLTAVFGFSSGVQREVERQAEKSNLDKAE